MKPVCDTQATVVDLLDRILDKGVMLNADVIISVAGIPLIGVNLRAAIASVDTMLRYGIWEDWDEAQRAIATEERRREGVDKLPLLDGETVIQKMVGSHWYSKGLYQSWRPGYLYVTDKRVFLRRSEPADMFFEVRYKDIEGFALAEKGDNVKNAFYLYLKSGIVEKLRPAEAVKEAIAIQMKELGLSFQRRPLPEDGTVNIRG
jgi:hypothetical protein